MTAWITCVNGLADGWGGALFRASWQGAIAIAFVWGICRGFPKIPARVRCWLWRLVYLKLLLALFWWQPVAELPLLPIPKEPPPLAELVAPPLEETAMPVGTSIERAIEETTPIGRGVEHVVVSAVPASPSPDLMAYLLLAWLLGVGWAAYLAKGVCT